METTPKLATGFRITGGKGFHVMFENGVTVSVQFGSGNYCANRDYTSDFAESDERAKGQLGSASAETAVWGADGRFIKQRSTDDDVLGWQTPADVLATLAWAASLPETK